MARRDRVVLPPGAAAQAPFSQGSVLSFYEAAPTQHEHGTVYALLPSRAQVLTALSANPGVDLLILGEGLTAACAAHQLALSGVRVALLSEHYFGVGNGAWALLRHHLGGSGVSKRLWWRWCLRRFLRSGLVAEHLRERGTRSRAVPLLPWLAEGLSGLWPQPYDERLLVRETVLAARQEGALCVSNTELLALESEGESGCYALTFRDRLGQGVYRVRAGAVLVDPHIPQLPSTQLGTRLGVVPAEEELFEYLQCAGTWCLRQEQRESLKLPVDVAQCVVWSSEAAGGTEVLIPLRLYRGDEQRRAELLSRVLEHNGVANGGVVHRRTVRHSVSRVSAGVVQRGGILWAQQRGPWDVVAVIRDVLRCMQAARSEEDRRPVRIEQRRLAGSLQDGEREAFFAAGAQAGVNSTLLRAVEGRWGGRVREIAGFARGFEEAAPGYLRGEVALAYWSDQVGSEEDLLFGSLCLQQSPNRHSLTAALGEVLRECGA